MAEKMGVKVDLTVWMPLLAESQLTALPHDTVLRGQASPRARPRLARGRGRALRLARQGAPLGRRRRNGDRPRLPAEGRARARLSARSPRTPPGHPAHHARSRGAHAGSGSVRDADARGGATRAYPIRPPSSRGRSGSAFRSRSPSWGCSCATRWGTGGPPDIMVRACHAPVLHSLPAVLVGDRQPGGVHPPQVSVRSALDPLRHRRLRAPWLLSSSRCPCSRSASSSRTRNRRPPRLTTPFVIRFAGQPVWLGNGAVDPRARVRLRALRRSARRSSISTPSRSPAGWASS